MVKLQLSLIRISHEFISITVVYSYCKLYTFYIPSGNIKSTIFSEPKEEITGDINLKYGIAFSVHIKRLFT